MDTPIRVMLVVHDPATQARYIGFFAGHEGFELFNLPTAERALEYAGRADVVVINGIADPVGLHRKLRSRNARQVTIGVTGDSATRGRMVEAHFTQAVYSLGSDLPRIIQSLRPLFKKAA